MDGSAESKINRISWIDVLKGIGIILVVIGHTSKNNFMVDWLYTFHMPLFFALSGYLWSQSNSNNSFLVFLQKRVKTLLWPFILFRVILVLYWIVVESHFRELDLGPIWFLIVLFVAEVAGYVVFDKRRDSIACSLIVFLVSALMLYTIGNILQIDTAVFSWILRFIDGFVWYVAGILTGNVCKVFKERSISNPCRLLILAGGGILTIAITFFNGNVSMWSNEFGLFPLFLLGGIVGSLTLALFCKWLVPHNRFIEFIGQNTVVILAVHEPIKRVILKVSEVLAGRIGINVSTDYLQHSIPASFLVVLVVVLISLVAVQVFRLLKNKLPEKVGNNLLAFVR